MNFVQYLAIVVIAIIMLNFVTEGWVFSRIGDVFSSPQGEAMKQSAMCAIGAFFITPIIVWNGFFIPWVGIDDLVIAFVGSVILFVFLQKLWDLQPWHSIIFFLLILVFQKIIGLLFIYMAPPSCMSLILKGNMLLSPVFFISLILGIPFLIWMFLKRAWVS